MQVLGDLLKLPDSSFLPIPWWHRAPLGLQTKTWCYLSIVRSAKRPVGDLVISVLDPHKWPKTVLIQSRRDDKPGVVSDAIAAVHDTNIALAESVTIESGAEHEVTLICETGGTPKPVTIRKRLVSTGFSVDSIRAYPARDIAWTRRVEIQSGWIKAAHWRKRLQKLFSEAPNFESIDLSKAVVSADTGNRLLRFVFPYRGARTIAVEHRDTPGAMKRVSDVLFRHNLNVLSMLLRRGGAKPENAILIAACEPKVDAEASDVYARVRADVESLPPKFMAEIHVSRGLDAARAIAPREAGTVVSRVPKTLVPIVKEERRAVRRGRIPVFFSRRFVSDRRALALGREVSDALEDNNCHTLEASPQEEVREPTVIFLEVTAKMWVARAGVVLVAGLPDVDAIGRNLPHEFGFLQGQSKPVLLLVEGGNAKTLRPWSNIDGVYAPRFPEDDEAVDRASSASIYQVVAEWTKKIRGR